MLENLRLSNYRPFLHGCNNPRLPPIKGLTCASWSQHRCRLSQTYLVHLSIARALLLLQDVAFTTMPLKLNSPDEHQLPMWFANTEIHVRDAGLANERVMLNLFRGALTSSQANTWAKFLYDTALTSSP